MNSATDCPACGAKRPPQRQLYCSDRCRETAKKQRQRARAAGRAVATPVPSAAQRRQRVVEEMAELLRAKRVDHDAVREQELGAAQSEAARLAAAVDAQRRELSRLRRELERERETRVAGEREIRFMAVAFARIVATHNIAEVVPAAIRSRVAKWIPVQENPWH